MNRNNQSQDKAKNFKSTIGRLFKGLSENKFLIFTTISFAILSAILTIIGPNRLSDITDLITEGIIVGIDTNEILKLSLILIGIYVFSWAFSFTQGIITSTINQTYCKNLRNKISHKVNRIPLKYFDSNTTGDILSRVSNDVDLVSQSLDQSLVTLFSSIFLLFGLIIMMFITNVVMTITAILASLIGFAVMGLILSKSQKYFNIQQNELGKLNGHIEEVYSSHNIVKVYNASDDVKETFNKYNDKLFTSAKYSQFLSGLMMPLMSFVGNFGYVAVTVMGAYLALEGYITFGVIVAYMIYVRLLTNSLSNMAQVMSGLQSIAAASERVFEFLDEEELVDESHKKNIIDNIKGHIKFENVKFGYDENKLIIKDFSSDIKAGQKIAIVGPTGAGKTTLVNLLMRFYEINEGNIIIDDVNIQDITRENVHELFCMVLQDTWLFEDTILNNIKYNQNNVTDKDVKKVCEEIGIDHLIKSLPNGYNTILSDAESLSSGEKQLLTIARASLSTSPFLILDEATSNVDTRTEKLVQKAMDKLTKGKTSFIIAHRLSTIKNADLILVLKNGNILEQGNHEELLKKNGFYADLYNSQFEN